MPVSVRHLEDSNSKLITSLLAKWTDGLYYVAKILESDFDARRFLVKFEDEAQQWMSADELHAQLDSEHVTPELVFCSLCDGGESQAPNEIIICDVCQQGYHVQCHKPAINRKRYKFDDDLVEWYCSTCKDIESGKSQSSTMTRASSQHSTNTPRKKNPSKKAVSQTPKVKLEIKKTPKKTPTKDKRLPKENGIVQSKALPNKKTDDDDELISAIEKLEKTRKAEQHQDIEKSQRKRSKETKKARAEKKENVEKQSKNLSAKPSAAKAKAVIPLTDEEIGEIEKMEPMVINTARALASKDYIATEDFVRIITSES